jgi:hypothetical protein
MVQQHAAMLAFVEAFWVMGVVFLLMLPFLPLLQYSKLARSPRAAEAGQRLIPSASAAEIESSFREGAVPLDLSEADTRVEEDHLVLHG